MNYKAMSGSVIIKINGLETVSKRDSGLVVVSDTGHSKGTVLAEIISVGDERDDLKVGMKLLFLPSTGMLIAKNTYYLKYEDICAIAIE